MDCYEHLETVQGYTCVYMYHTHTMDKVHGINLSTCSDLPLMNIMIISQIDLQWTQFNWIFDLHLILRLVHCLIFKEERMLRYLSLSKIERSNQLRYESPFISMQFQTCICQLFQIVLDTVIS